MNAAQKSSRAALSVLLESDPNKKTAAAFSALAASRAGQLQFDADIPGDLPDRPERSARPAPARPEDVPKRGLGSVEGRIALLHAIAHIELNAIDLAFDMAVRFAAEIGAAGLNVEAFIKDWFEVGGDEARHFRLICNRLEELGTTYGDLPAHHGLWDAALSTRHDVLARLAVAPMVLEARGLDVTPGMIKKLTSAADKKSAAVLQLIYEEEVGHVSKGVQWFEAMCGALKHDPENTFKSLVKSHFSGKISPPFNQGARADAGMRLAFYRDYL